MNLTFYLSEEALVLDKLAENIYRCCFMSFKFVYMGKKKKKILFFAVHHWIN